VTDKLGAKDAVPRETRVFGEVGHQRDVAVRQRRDDELFFEARETLGRVGPRLQAVPRAVEVRFLGLAEPTDAELVDDPIQRHPVQVVESGPGELTGSNAVHAWSVTRAPGVCELLGVDRQPPARRELADFRGNRRAPVDDGAEHVEDERLDGGKIAGLARRRPARCAPSQRRRRNGQRAGAEKRSAGRARHGPVSYTGPSALIC
jgi:hypothetical protein